MSHVEYTGVTDTQARGAAAVNAIFQAFVTASSAVDYTNIADEGLDNRNVATGEVTDGRDSVEYTGGGATPVLGDTAIPTYLVFAPAATSHILTNTPGGGTGWSVGENVGTVRCTFGAEWSRAHTGATSPTLRFQLQYQIDSSGVWVDVPKSNRFFIGTAQIAVNTAGAILDANWYDSFRYTFDIPFPLDGAAHTIDKIQVVAADSVAPHNTISFKHTFFRAKRFIKAV